VVWLPAGSSTDWATHRDRSTEQQPNGHVRRTLHASVFERFEEMVERRRQTWLEDEVETVPSLVAVRFLSFNSPSNKPLFWRGRASVVKKLLTPALFS
jgi:hypothetical protein